MARFALGVLLGVLLGAGGAWLALRKPSAETAAATVSVADAGPAAADPKAKGKKKRRGARGGGSGGGGSTFADVASDGDEGEPLPEVAVSSDDLRIVSEGDSLALSERKLDLAEGAPEPRDLGQDEIDTGVSARAQAVIRCITDARGPAAVTGQITVKFVVSAKGSVTQTRVAAPAYLMKHGLGACVRPQLRQMRFPATGKDSVITVPFDLS